jgi:hypothetical protein
VLSVKRRFSFRQKLGAGLYDLPRLLWATRSKLSRPKGTAPWVFVRNRSERLIPSPDGLGVQCDWEWTSDLHVANVFPRLGLSLMQRAFNDWPIDFQPERATPNSPVEVSFIVGHRGLARLPLLLSTLRCIAAQRRVGFECLVVEQSAEPEVEDKLPSWVRYMHAPTSGRDDPYCRARAFNIGARLAQSETLIFHDNDLLVPQDYAAEIVARCGEGYEVVNLKRFIFYLTESHSRCTTAMYAFTPAEAPESIMQNAQGGGSVAITRKAFFAIGGFDETFIGWGGEDNEFWERAQTRKVWPYGYMPVLHLWHESQPDKVLGEDAPAKRKYWELTTIPADQRIRNLLQRQTAQT